MDSVLVDKIKDALKSLPISKAWVFGSYARGEQNEVSDLDLLVSYLPGQRPGLFGMVDISYQLEEKLGLKVDLVENGTLYPRVQKEVDLQKIPIYERVS